MQDGPRKAGLGGKRGVGVQGVEVAREPVQKRGVGARGKVQHHVGCAVWHS